MKKILVAVAVTLLGSSAAFAASNISGTKHNLSSGASTSQVRSNESQICAFCHTPHNASPNVPLWNRNSTTASSYQLYTSSASLTSATKASKLTSTSISLLCLSCHDAALQDIGDRINKRPNDTTPTMYDGTASTWATRGANLGSDLTNDHPIGFSYDNALADTAEAGLRTKAIAKTRGASFFGAGADSVECSSCHLVHDNTNAPFLRTSNVGSSLCLACHAK